MLAAQHLQAQAGQVWITPLLFHINLWVPSLNALFWICGQTFMEQNEIVDEIVEAKVWARTDAFNIL